MDGERERGEGGRREQRSEGEEQRSVGGREGGKLQGRYPEEDNGQYTAHKTMHNTAFAIVTLILQIQNCKRVYKLCIVMRRNVLFDRWMT